MKKFVTIITVIALVLWAYIGIRTVVSSSYDDIHITVNDEDINDYGELVMLAVELSEEESFWVVDGKELTKKEFGNLEEFSIFNIGNGN